MCTTKYGKLNFTHLRWPDAECPAGKVSRPPAIPIRPELSLSQQTSCRSTTSGLGACQASSQVVCSCPRHDLGGDWHAWPTSGAYLHTVATRPASFEAIAGSSHHGSRNPAAAKCSHSKIKPIVLRADWRLTQAEYSRPDHHDQGTPAQHGDHDTCRVYTFGNGRRGMESARKAEPGSISGPRKEAAAISVRGGGSSGRRDGSF
jgi:hypothetical protein